MLTENWGADLGLEMGLFLLNRVGGAVRVCSRFDSHSENWLGGLLIQVFRFTGGHQLPSYTLAWDLADTSGLLGALLGSEKTKAMPRVN